MSRSRRKQADPLELLPPIFALVALAVFFVPGFRKFLGGLFILLLWLVVLLVLGLIAWFIWRKVKATQESGENGSMKAAQDGVHSASTLVNPLGWTALPREPVWTQELLSQLEWKRFEDVVAAYSRHLGFDAKTTRTGADGGVDVQLFRNGLLVMIIQCKAWDAYKVGVKPVRELFGVMAADRVANGAFFTSGEFTSEAEAWARGKDLDLVNGREFLSRIRQLTPVQQASLLAVAITGDYITPTCPSCGVKMVTRTASKGPSEGRDFYGCRNYPRCRQTFRLPQPA